MGTASSQFTRIQKHEDNRIPLFLSAVLVFVFCYNVNIIRTMSSSSDIASFHMGNGRSTRKNAGGCFSGGGNVVNAVSTNTIQH